MSNSISMKHILMTTDLSGGQDLPFAHGLKLALSSRGRLTLVHVQPPKGSPDWTSLPTVKDMLLQWGVLDPDHPSSDYEHLGLEVHPVTEEALDPLPALVQHAVRLKPDLLVLNPLPRTGMEQLTQYSMSEHVARASGIPALFLPRGHRGIVDPVSGTPRLNRILVPVGGDMPLQDAVSWTSAMLELLEVERAEIVLLHVGETWEGALEVPARSGWDWRPVARPGLVVPVIVDLAEELAPDLVVMATQGGQGALRGILGSHTERVINRVHCPVLAIPV